MIVEGDDRIHGGIQERFVYGDIRKKYVSTYNMGRPVWLGWSPSPTLSLWKWDLYIIDTCFVALWSSLEDF